MSIYDAKFVPVGEDQVAHLELAREVVRRFNKVFGGSVPKEFIPSIEYGARMACKTGVLANYPLINIKITLVDGSYHQVDS